MTTRVRVQCDTCRMPWPCALSDTPAPCRRRAERVQNATVIGRQPARPASGMQRSRSSEEGGRRLRGCSCLFGTKMCSRMSTCANSIAHACRAKPFGRFHRPTPTDTSDRLAIEAGGRWHAPTARAEMRLLARLQRCRGRKPAEAREGMPAHRGPPLIIRTRAEPCLRASTEPPMRARLRPAEPDRLRSSGQAADALRVRPQARQTTRVQRHHRQRLLRASASCACALRSH
jgi:hypothetical protein